MAFQYRVIAVNDQGIKVFISPMQRNIVDARASYAVIRRDYDEFVDVYIEEREVTDWERCEPLVPVNQPELPI